MLAGNYWLKSMSKITTEKYLKSMSKLIKNLSLSHRCYNQGTFFLLCFLYYTVPWALEMSKYETITVRRMVIKLDFVIIARKPRLLIFSSSKFPVLSILWGNCKFFLPLHLGLTLQLLHVKVELFPNRLCFMSFC